MNLLADSLYIVTVLQLFCTALNKIPQLQCILQLAKCFGHPVFLCYKYSFG
jgi:hypothetical protein